MSAWKDFVTASLLGMEKGGALPIVPTALESTLAPATGLEREARFLTHAGALALWRRAGWKPTRDETPLPSPTPPETGRMIAPASIAHLRAMFGGHCTEVLPEWLGEVARRQLRLPPEFLPALLDWARQNRARRPLVLAAGGSRLHWLADQNPEWNFAVDDSPEHWETGSRDRRVAILRRWRTENPAEAREKLAAVWKTEPADARTAFTDILGNGLTDGDIPFLENALDDRSKEVRQRAAGLLALLPDSPLVARMITRAQELLVFKSGGLLRRASLEVHLPPDPDPAAIRDGLDPKAFGPQKNFGEKAVGLIAILAAVPLRHWTDTFKQSPGDLLAALKKSEFGPAVATGWALAALNQRDAAWAEALLDSPVPPDGILLAGNSSQTLFELLPEATRAARLIADLRAGGLPTDQSAYMAWHRLTTQFASFEDMFPEALARELLAVLRRYVADSGQRHWQVSGARTWLLRLPPALLPAALEGWPSDKPGVDEILALLGFRRDALAALVQA